MTFIERKDGTVYDPEFEREKKMEEEQKVKDAAYEKHMRKVLESAASNRTEWSPMQFF